MAIRAPLDIPAEDGPDRDRALIQSHVGGDTGAFQQLVLRHYQSMLGHAYRRLHDAQAAEDAVQDALVRAYRSLGASHEDYRLGPWLHRIVDNVCTDEAARRHREYEATRRFQADLTVLRPVEDDSPDLEYVSAAIAALPSGYRDALMMRDVLELEYADVAEQAGITEQNARARVSRARAALRKLVASTVTVWLVLGRFVRRGTIGTPKLIREVSASAATLPQEAVISTTRGISAASTIALTAVAVASVAAPAFMPGAPSSPTASSDQSSVKSGPQAGSSQIAALPRVGSEAYAVAAAPPAALIAGIAPAVEVAPRASTTVTLKPKVAPALPPTTTTTAIVKRDPNQPAYPAWTGTAVPALSGPPIPPGDLTAPGLQDAHGPTADALAGSGAMGWGQSGATGRFGGSLGTPESRCGSPIEGTLDMTSPSQKPWTLRFNGELSSAWSDSKTTSWGFVGQVVASGSSEYSGAGWIQGIVQIASDGTVEVTGHVWGPDSAAAPKGPGSCTAPPAASSPSPGAASGGTSGAGSSEGSAAPSSPPQQSGPAAPSRDPGSAATGAPSAVPAAA